MDFRPSNLIFHDYGGNPDNADGVFNPYHALVFPDGRIRYRNPSNPYGSKAPHAYKMNGNAIGLSYAGPVGSKPTPQALATLKSESQKIARMFPGIRPMSHGQAYEGTKGTASQASKLGRGLDEALWRNDVVYGPPAPGGEATGSAPIAARGLTSYAGLSKPPQQSPTPTNEAPSMPNMTGVPIPASYSPEGISMQRRMAERLMQQGTDASPVGHWTQALARVLQGGMGGYMAGQANKQEGAMRNEGTQLLAQALSGMGGGQAGGLDPAMIPQLLNNPQTAPYAESYIKKRMMADNEESPSNVREWEYFQKLSPEDQQRYITMKRAEKYLDTGTQFVQPNAVNPQAEPRVIQKNLAEAEKQKEIGTAQGKQIASAPGDISAAEQALTVLDAIRKDENIDRGTGFSSYGNMFRGTGGYDFETLVNQAKSGAFLTAIQQLRGMGALSNSEGQTATSAVTRMDVGMSKEAFLAAVDAYEAVIRKGMAKARSMLGQGASLQAMPTESDGWQDIGNGIRIREKR